MEKSFESTEKWHACYKFVINDSYYMPYVKRMKRGKLLSLKKFIAL